MRIGETAASVGRDCKRSRLVPGFVDAHAHVITGGFARGMIDLSNARSRSDFVETLAKGISRGDGAWTLASGWDESRWSEKETPRIEWLDDRFDGVKVFALRADAHVGFASAAALEAAGLMDENVEIKGGIIERDEAGTPTGVVKELATVGRFRDARKVGSRRLAADSSDVVHAARRLRIGRKAPGVERRVDEGGSKDAKNVETSVGRRQGVSRWVDRRKDGGNVGAVRGRSGYKG